MNNNDILIRLRYALDIKDTDMMEMFQLGGITITKEDLQRMLLKPKHISNEADEDAFIPSEDMKKCSNHILEAFLNGFILSKRGKPETKPGEAEKQQIFMIKDNKSVNNVMMKKVKIALSLTSEDILSILKEAGLDLSNGELSALFRKEGQRNYKECGDRYARNFLKGLALRYRK